MKNTITIKYGCKKCGANARVMSQHLRIETARMEMKKRKKMQGMDREYENKVGTKSRSDLVPKA